MVLIFYKAIFLLNVFSGYFAYFCRFRENVLKLGFHFWCDDDDDDVACFWVVQISIFKFCHHTMAAFETARISSHPPPRALWPLHSWSVLMRFSCLNRIFDMLRYGLLMFLFNPFRVYPINKNYHKVRSICRVFEFPHLQDALKMLKISDAWHFYGCA